MASQGAQDEFNALFNKNGYDTGKLHPEDAAAESRDRSREASPSPSQSFYHSDNDDAGAMAVNNMRSTYYIPRTTRQANTGPKGVIADAQAFEEARRQAALGQHSQQPAKEQKKSRRTSILGRQRSQERREEREKSSASSDDDDAFMASWRKRRLQELTQKPFNHFLGQSGKRIYGSLSRVDAEGFLNAVEGAPADTVVVCLIYDGSEISLLVEDACREMARTHTTTRFIKLHYAEAEFEQAGVPAILAYKGGEKFAGFVPVSEEIADHEELSARVLTNLLQRHQVL